MVCQCVDPCDFILDRNFFSATQAKAFRPHDEDDDDDSDFDYSDDEDLQSPIDEVDPFVFFVDTVKG